jgi:predicted dehydrogenase
MTMATVRTAVVGVGHFGRYHAEKHSKLENTDFIGVVDICADRARAAAETYQVEALTDYRDLFGRVDAVSISASTNAHYEIAHDCLENGINVLIEKPMAVTIGEAESLIDVARRKGLVLQVGHLERFSPVRLSLDGHIDQPLFVECVRTAPYGTREPHVSVILDMMIHDIDLILDIVKGPIEKIDAVGVPVLSPVEDIAVARIHFADGCVANITASRISLKTERAMRLFQRDAHISIDFLNRTFTKTKIGHNGHLSPVDTFDESDADADSLYLEIESFVDCVRYGNKPLVSGEDGRRALETALQIRESLQEWADDSEFLGELATGTF